MSRQIVNTESGRAKSEALKFAVIAAVAGIVTLVIFVALNGGLHDSTEKWTPTALAASGLLGSL
jgi:hypothetical protein